MIFKYSQFVNEIKRSKLEFFKNKEISDKFTSSIEIELETLDLENIDVDYTDEYVNEIIYKIKRSVDKELLRINEFEMTEEIEEFIEDLLSEIRYEYDDYDYIIDDLLESENYGDENYKHLIVELMRQQVLTYFFSDNFEYLEEKFKENFNSFFKKYKDLIKFELDNTLDRGIELSNKTYFDNINDLIVFINDFYNDYNNQEYWKFTERTGIHINLGIKEKSNYNFIKGLLFLNDQGDDPFVFKNMEWRKNSKFCGSLLQKLSDEKELISNCKNILNETKNLNEVEDILNSKLKQILKNEGYKNFGVNLVPIDKFNYIEFRYPGGEISNQTLVDKVLYFTYITYLMNQSKFERDIYIKKLYKFLNK